MVHCGCCFFKKTQQQLYDVCFKRWTNGRVLVLLPDILSQLLRSSIFCLHINLTWSKYHIWGWDTKASRGDTWFIYCHFCSQGKHIQPSIFSLGKKEAVFFTFKGQIKEKIDRAHAHSIQILFFSIFHEFLFLPKRRRKKWTIIGVIRGRKKMGEKSPFLKCVVDVKKISCHFSKRGPTYEQQKKERHAYI